MSTDPSGETRTQPSKVFGIDVDGVFLADPAGDRPEIRTFVDTSPTERFSGIRPVLAYDERTMISILI